MERYRFLSCGEVPIVAIVIRPLTSISDFLPWKWTLRLENSNGYQAAHDYVHRPSTTCKNANGLDYLRTYRLFLTQMFPLLFDVSTNLEGILPCLNISRCACSELF